MHALCRKDAGWGSPIVTLLPMMVGSDLLAALCFATWITALSNMLVFSPTFILFTSPARQFVGASAKQLAEGSVSVIGSCSVHTGGCAKCCSAPRRIAPYQMEELLPTVTSPINDALGATKATELSTGRLPLYACSV